MIQKIKAPVIACVICFLWISTAMAQDHTTSTEPMLLIAEDTAVSAPIVSTTDLTEPTDTGTLEAVTTAATVQQGAPAHSVVTTESTATAVEETATTQIATTTEPDDTSTSVTTPEGVVYQVLRHGTGPEETTTQTLLLHYTLYVSGRKLESSRDAEFPVPLKLKRNTDSFIKGFEIGTEGMRVGEVRRIYIPAELGYGEKGNEVIPPNSPLIFETELVDLK